MKLLTTPTCYGADKSRSSGSGFRSKGFAITDLLGLESDFRPHQPGTVEVSEQHEVGDEGHGTGTGGFSWPAGSLPLGLGFLCSLASQQQPSGAPCFLPGHIPLLHSRNDRHFNHNTDPQRLDGYSGRSLPCFCVVGSCFFFPPDTKKFSGCCSCALVLK